MINFDLYENSGNMIYIDADDFHESNTDFDIFNIFIRRTDEV